MNMMVCIDCKSENVVLCGPQTIERPKTGKFSEIRLSACCPDCGMSFWIIYSPTNIEERNGN